MVIYKITNLINGKSYIGQTIRPLKYRISQHRSLTKSPISNAINLYGFQNFEISIIMRCDNINELNEREKFCIRIFNTVAPNGYNLALGGLNSSPTPETRAKLSKMYTGVKRQPRTEETKRKISEANKGRKTALGRKVTEETKRKIGLANKGRKTNVGLKRSEKECKIIGERSKIINCKKVINIETKEIVSSVKLLAEKLNMNRYSVTGKLNGHNKNTLNWVYLEKYNETEAILEELRDEHDTIPRD